MLNQVPEPVSSSFQAQLLRQVSPDAAGHFYLVGARLTAPRTAEEQRVIVRLIDINNRPMADIKVGFHYSTAPGYVVGSDFLWQPPLPRRAFIVPTNSAGVIDQIQGSAKKPDEPGGIAVGILDPRYSSDFILGVGMLQDHTGVEVTLQLIRPGEITVEQQLSEIRADLAALVNSLEEMRDRLAAHIGENHG